jgi:hypothetical protein
MSQIDFTAQLQEAGLKVQHASAQVLDFAQKATASQAQLFQEQAEANFDLARSSLAIRDLEGFKSFWFDAARVTREGVERVAQGSQQFFADQVKLTESLGRQAKEQVEAATAKATKRR